MPSDLPEYYIKDKTDVLWLGNFAKSSDKFVISVVYFFIYIKRHLENGFTVMMSNLFIDFIKS